MRIAGLPLDFNSLTRLWQTFSQTEVDSDGTREGWNEAQIPLAVESTPDEVSSLSVALFHMGLMKHLPEPPAFNTPAKAGRNRI
jgi:hypothetical protein